MLRKGVYPYEYGNSWKSVDEILILNKEDFYSSLHMESIADVDYRHENKVLEEFKMNDLGDNLDLFVQDETLLLADVFENFRNKCIEIYELDPPHFLSDSGLAWQTCLKKTRITLELLAVINMLLLVEKGNRGGICHVHIRVIEQALDHTIVLRNCAE